ncbi:MAG: 50S ribosomal protein L3 [Elusimicrobia bacterium CG08_land_8_20_14_0_20_44_26]|nr:MAG: 50S ribosomal protein L3 [Elusimicrobia bacterium CG08_land_8_20_14_0_20_44_26]
MEQALKSVPGGVIGIKAGMMRIYEGDKELACTVIDVPANYVLALKTDDKDGYSAVKLAIAGNHRTKPIAGIIKNSPLTGIRAMREIKGKFDLKPGDKIDIKNVFEKGMRVAVTGLSKGKGFASTRKRWGFHGGPKSHGQKDKYHSPGSIGASSWPSRVIPGMKMAGRKGSARVTLKNLKVAAIFGEKNRLFITGAVPGRRGSLLLISRMERGKRNPPLNLPLEKGEKQSREKREEKSPS